jgi:hypothetical protein
MQKWSHWSPKSCAGLRKLTVLLFKTFFRPGQVNKYLAKMHREIGLSAFVSAPRFDFTFRCISGSNIKCKNALNRKCNLGFGPEECHTFSAETGGRRRRISPGPWRRCSRCCPWGWSARSVWPPAANVFTLFFAVTDGGYNKLVRSYPAPLSGLV